MKNAPKLRFKGFSGEWQAKKLGDVFDVTSGTTPSRSVNEFFHNGQHHWIKTTDLNNGYVTDTQDKVTDLALKKTSLKLLPEGTVLVAMYGGFNQIGRTGLLTRKAAINQALSALLPKIDVVNPYYLLSYLNFHVEDWKNFAASSRKDPNITKNDVLNFEFSYPILAEQTKIADFLTAIDDRISQLSQKCDGLAQYKKGVMQKIFSQELRFKDEKGRAFPAWEEKEVGDVFRVTRGNVLSMSLVNEKTSDLNKYPVYSSQTKNNGLSGYFNEYLYENSITWTTDGANAGEVNYRNGKFYCTNVCGVLISEYGYANECIAAMINAVSKKYVSYVGNPKLMNGVMAKIPISFPCLEEQAKIAGFVGAVDEKISKAQAQLDALKQYKQGLLQQMFV